jgi:hypothetical protein
MVKTINGIYRNLVDLDVTFDIQHNIIECKSQETFNLLTSDVLAKVNIIEEKYISWQATVDGIHVIYIKVKGE